MDKQIVVKNLLVSYREIAGDKPAVLFLHGWRSQKEIWRDVIERLKDLKIERLAVDMPGFGKSEMPRQPLTVGNYADMMAEFASRLDLQKIIVIGHSFGGRVGIKLAAQHPELISKLILADSAGFPMKASKKKFMAAAAKIVKPIFKQQIMQRLRKKIYKTIGAEDYLATPELQKTFVNITSEDLSDDMKKISCPSLIINGEDDHDTSVEFGNRMHSLIPNSKFIILPDAGHFSFLDQPEEFVKIIKNFI